MPTALPPLARTSAEAHLYLDLHPCECGQTAFPRDTAILELDAGEPGTALLGSRYEGECPGCGTHREFVFRLPAQARLPLPGQVVYGDGTPSELLDPGEWMWVADRYAASVPASTTGFDDQARGQVRARLSAAAAAMDEVLAFVPADADAVPAATVRSELGRDVYDEDAGRFEQYRLEIVRDTYRQLLQQIDLAPQ
jgi:hypothetical protein